MPAFLFSLFGLANLMLTRRGLLDAYTKIASLKREMSKIPNVNRLMLRGLFYSLNGCYHRYC